MSGKNVWTTQAPTAPGWWWWRLTPDHPGSVYHVIESTLGELYVVGYGGLEGFAEGQWASVPYAEPDDAGEE